MSGRIRSGAVRRTPLPHVAAPCRLQQARTPGWRKPPSSFCVCRPTVWGNPFVAGLPSGFSPHSSGDNTPLIARATREQVCDWFDSLVKTGHVTPEMEPFGSAWLARFHRVMLGEDPIPAARRVLRGLNLLCFCPAPRPGERDLCHAQTWLEVANG
jgi:hypothetical protein